MFFGGIVMIASETHTQLDETPTQHSTVIGHCGLAGVACQSSVTLNTTSPGSITNRDSWCLNYQGLLCPLSSFLLVLFTLWHLSLFFQVKGHQGHMLPRIWEGGHRWRGLLYTHRLVFLQHWSFGCGRFHFKTIGLFTITSTVFPWKHERPLGQGRHSGFILHCLIYWSYF